MRITGSTIKLAALLLITTFANAALAEPHHQRQHQVVAFFGAMDEKDAMGDRERGGVVGIGYQYNLDDRWHIVTAIEDVQLQGDIERETIVYVGFGYNITHAWSVFAGPGLEGRRVGELEHRLLRVGTGYHFSLGERIAIAPEVYFDFLEDDRDVFVLGMAFSYAF